MEFLTAFPAWHICEYNNRYTKKVRKEVNEISREHISQSCAPYSVNRNTLGKIERFDTCV